MNLLKTIHRKMKSRHCEGEARSNPARGNNHSSLKKNFSFSWGVTLVEMMIVIAVIGILMTVASMSARTAFEKAKRSKATLEAREIIAAVRAYHAAYGEWPLDPLPTTWTDVGSDLIATLRKDGTNFIEITSKSLVNGRFVDPWKTNAYQIIFQTMESRERVNEYSIVVTPIMFDRKEP